MNITIMLTPGPFKLIEVRNGATVIDVARKAAELFPVINNRPIDWVGLVKAKAVFVNKRKYSNTESINEDQGYGGSIFTTSLENADIIMVILSGRIKGNESGALTCTINDQGYALATPDTIANVLRDVVGQDPDDVTSVTVNGYEADLEDLVGDEDEIEVSYVTDAPEDDGAEAVIKVDGETFEATPEGKLAAIQAILEL